MKTYTIENFPAYIGDYTVTHGGQNYRVKIEFDDDTRPEEYGLVARAGHYRDKHPGELLLKDGVFFDFSACCELAREEGWGYIGYNPEESEETPRQVAARAAREVFEYLKAWYQDEWHYVGVTVYDSQGSYLDSMWGIESPDTDSLREVVRETVEEAEAGRALQEMHRNYMIDPRGV